MTGVVIRKYKETDQLNCVDLFRLNVPSAFAPEEELDVIHYLNHETEDYFVAEASGQIIGAGGINYFHAELKARISWDFIHPQWHGKGVGSLLLSYRLQYLASHYAGYQVEVRTSQFAYLFYQKHGFTLMEVIPDYWSAGYDLYAMQKTPSS